MSFLRLAKLKNLLHSISKTYHYQFFAFLDASAIINY
ncbi:hypothetical protein B6N60_02415 [Richelia sinica FACHB-800]|uniref:Uncharacterized protein n=1 Tax=Richelia sinica FACHB-800 TaxID=1357546 RepID=A0A975T7Y2_9NOST|nr:hypothetical protein B6N60_02415 [Richelia sinica FACHB-800]